MSGVSITTVSHVVNRTRTVRPETEAAVPATVGRVGYPSSTTRADTESRILGVASSAFSNSSTTSPSSGTAGSP